MATPLRVLFVEDGEDDVLLVSRELRRGGYDPIIERVELPEAMHAALAKGLWDLVLVDYSLPQFSAPAALELFKESGLDLPFIVVSGAADEETMVQLMKSGAHDYISKRKLTRLVPAVQRELSEAKIRGERRQAEAALRQSHEQLRRTLEGVVQAMAMVTEKRDPYTAGHQKRVSKLACSLARILKLDSHRIEGLRIAALLHDIGKISVPAEILSRTGELSSSEFAMIQTHPRIACDILQEIDFPWPVSQIILEHHERLDGSGYPEGILGEKLSSEARILAVADVMEAMSSHRPYRPARGIEEALRELVLNSGILYDAEAVDACSQLFVGQERPFDLEGKRRICEAR